MIGDRCATYRAGPMALPSSGLCAAQSSRSGLAAAFRLRPPIITPAAQPGSPSDRIDEGWVRHSIQWRLVNFGAVLLKRGKFAPSSYHFV
jgi:hypothetical protein